LHDAPDYPTSAPLTEHLESEPVRTIASRSGLAWPADDGTLEQDREAGVTQGGHADGLPAIVSLPIEQHHPEDSPGAGLAGSNSGSATIRYSQTVTTRRPTSDPLLPSGAEPALVPADRFDCAPSASRLVAQGPDEQRPGRRTHNSP
jgi:hypothetical protein